MRSYYRNWLRTAFTQSIGVFDLWTGLITALLGVLDHYAPDAQVMTAYAWQIPIWALAAVMAVRLLMAPYWMAKEKEERIRSLESERKSLFDEYSHSLQLISVSAEDRRKLDAETKTKVIERHARFVIKFHNAIARPIRYTVINLQINGSPQPATVNSGIIVGNGDASYYTNFIELPIDTVDNVYNATLSIKFEYGPADYPATREVNKVLNMEVFPENKILHFLYSKDVDEPKINGGSGVAQQIS